MPCAENAENDGADPDSAVADGPVVAEVLAVGGVFLYAGDDAGQDRVHAEEAVKDMGLDAEPFGAHWRRQEAAEVAAGVAPLLSVHELLQAAWAADGVRLAEHPARSEACEALGEKERRGAREMAKERNVRAYDSTVASKPYIQRKAMSRRCRNRLTHGYSAPPSPQSLPSPHLIGTHDITLAGSLCSAAPRFGENGVWRI